MEVLCSLNRLRPKFWPVALGKACKISGNYINTFGLSIMGEYAPTENRMNLIFKIYSYSFSINSQKTGYL
jgi:hypothetical protein